MKAIIVNHDSDHISLDIGNLPKPKIAPDEVLIKIKAASLNRADILQKQGKYPPPPGASQILGLDCAGIIEEIGAQVKGFQKGDRVMALLSGGGYAEFINVHQNLLMKIPNNLNFEQATAIPEVFLTAFQTLFWIGNLKPEENVLIHAGASGVGSAAIQLARIVKAKQIFITAGNSDKIDFCKNLGATTGINYNNEDFQKIIEELTHDQGVNLILDFIGATYFKQNLKCLDFDGKLILIAAMGGFKIENFNILPFLLKRVQVFGTTLRSRSLDYKAKLTREFSEKFLHLFLSEELKPIVDKIFPISQANQAHNYMENNLNKGKIILNMDEF